MINRILVSIVAMMVTMSVHATAEVITAAVVFSTPYFEKNQEFKKSCSFSECTYEPIPAKQFKTVFQNGYHQITLLTKRQLPQDVWYDISRVCTKEKCIYNSVTVSEYQSPETLAIQEIIERERNRPWQYRDFFTK